MVMVALNSEFVGYWEHYGGDLVTISQAGESSFLGGNCIKAGTRRHIILTLSSTLA
jgi:hypothetical protein